LRAVPIQFHAVVVGIPQVQRLTDAVVARPIQGNARVKDTTEGIGQCTPCRVQNRGVVQARRSRRRRRTTQALPGVETDVVMIAARRHEGSLRPVPLRQLKAKDSAVKPECPLQVGDLQMDVTDADLGINRVRRFVVMASPSLSYPRPRQLFLGLGNNIGR
jgi:hypothetical protein